MAHGAKRGSSRQNRRECAPRGKTRGGGSASNGVNRGAGRGKTRGAAALPDGSVKSPAEFSAKFLAVGQLPASMRKIGDEMSKKLGIRWTEIPDVPDADVKTAVRRESDMLLERIDKKDYVVLFDLGGENHPAALREAFSRPNAVFVVGGSNGFDDRVRARANLRISVSDFTYPHALFRLAVLEILSSLIF